jgi:hypothetical protein
MATELSPEEKLAKAQLEAQQAAEKAKKAADAAKAAVAASSAINTIIKSIPSSSKPKGIDKIPSLLLNQSVFIEQFLQKKITELVQSKVSDVCLPADQIDQLITQRNNIIDELNKVGKTLDVLTATIVGTNLGFNVFVSLVTTLKRIKTGASTGVKFAPTVPGAVVSLINDLGDISDRITWNNLGTSKLQKIQDALSATVIPVALIGSNLNKLTTQLNQLDTYLKKCASPTSIPLTEVSSNIQEAISAQQQSETTTSETTYQGFVIKIEEVPYSDNINRKKAVGYNVQGVPIISTELSFTASDQTLIDELKLIIDRDNLKAY